MEEDTVVALPRPGSGVMDDPLLAVLREGARRMLTQAIEAEVETFLAAHAGLADEQGRRRLVRNGHAPERRLQTGIGPLEVRRPKLRDRGGVADGEPIRFTSAVLPAYLRRTRNIEELLPWLYLKGVSTGQFAEALTALLGPEAPGLSPATVRRLTDQPLAAARGTSRRGDAGGGEDGPGRRRRAADEHSDDRAPGLGGAYAGEGRQRGHGGGRAWYPARGDPDGTGA